MDTVCVELSVETNGIDRKPEFFLSLSLTNRYLKSIPKSLYLMDFLFKFA